MTESTPITLDKGRNIRVDLMALEYFEKETGINSLSDDFWHLKNREIGKGKDKKTIPIPGISATNLLALLWACLLHEDPELKKETIGRYVTPKDFAGIAITMMIEWFKYLPKEEDLEKPEKGEDKKKVTDPQL